MSETTEAGALYCSEEICNLINTNGDVISIITPHVFHGPFSLMIPQVDLSLHIASNSKVCTFPSGLQAGSLEIDTRFAQHWDPQPPWSTLRKRHGIVQDGLQIVSETLIQFAPPESLAGLVVHLPRTQSPVTEKMLSLASEPAYLLIKGVRTDDVNLCVQGAKGLAGLGAGITPDGDDWIMGSSLAAWLMKPHQEAQRLNSAIAEAAIPLTTPISAAWIHAASRGECAEPWHDLFDYLSSRNENEIREASKQMVMIGHSSGASAVAGFLAPFIGLT